MIFKKMFLFELLAYGFEISTRIKKIQAIKGKVKINYHV